MKLVARLALAVLVLVVGGVVGYTLSSAQQASPLRIQTLQLDPPYEFPVFVKIQDGRNVCYLLRNGNADVSLDISNLICMR